MRYLMLAIVLFAAACGASEPDESALKDAQAEFLESATGEIRFKAYETPTDAELTAEIVAAAKEVREAGDALVAAQDRLSAAATKAAESGLLLRVDGCRLMQSDVATYTTDWTDMRRDVPCQVHQVFRETTIYSESDDRLANQVEKATE